MQLKQRINAFVQVGNFILRHFSTKRKSEEANLHLGLGELIKTAQIYNGWFIEEFANHALKNIGNVLTQQDIETLCQKLPAENSNPKTVAVICAGNIPMVGFHDILCILLAGDTVLIKLSTDDNVLLPFFLKLLVHYEPEFDTQIRLSDGRLTNFDAIIATGSNNTANYFDYYFSKYPSIIRKNRSSLAVLTGKESSEQLGELGKDIFYYYGLGCRNVSKLLVPQDYNFNHFFESIFKYAYLADNKKYANNYEYNRTIYLMATADFLDNNFLIIKPDNQIHAPISVVFYERYKNQEEVNDYLEKNRPEIQCIVGQDYIPFGNSQSPVITDFADDINTMNFLVNL